MSCETCCQTPAISVTPAAFEIAPDRRRAERQPEMKARRFQRRRAEQYGIVAMMDGGHLHHRAGARRGGVIAGELAERALRQGFFAHRDEPAFKDDFRMGRNRQPGLRSLAHFDRRAFDRAGEFVFRTAVGQIFEAGDEQCRILAMHDGERTALAAIPVFLGDDRAVPAAMIELHRDLVRAVHLDPVDRGVDPAAVRIAHDDERARSDERPAIMPMPDRRRKTRDIHVGTARSYSAKTRRS
jgi:hypothetical protein